MRLFSTQNNYLITVLDATLYFFLPISREMLFNGGIGKVKGRVRKFCLTS